MSFENRENVQFLPAPSGVDRFASGSETVREFWEPLSAFHKIFMESLILAQD